MNKILAVLLAVLVIAGAGLWFSVQPKGTDQEQIGATLSRAQKAIKSKSLGGVLDCVSTNYEGFGGDKQQLGAALVGLFRDSGDISVVLDTPRIRVTGETADVSTKVRATVTSEDGGGSEFTYDNDVHFEFARENVKRYLVIPVQAWRVTSADLKTGVENLF